MLLCSDVLWRSLEQLHFRECRWFRWFVHFRLATWRCGLTLGLHVGTALNTPFDVVKSRIQGATKVPGVVPKYNWTYPSLVIIAREEGLRALYKGFVPKVLRLAPGGGVLLLVVEATLTAFRKGHLLIFRPIVFNNASTYSPNLSLSPWSSICLEKYQGSAPRSLVRDMHCRTTVSMTSFLFCPVCARRGCNRMCRHSSQVQLFKFLSNTPYFAEKQAGLVWVMGYDSCLLLASRASSPPIDCNMFFLKGRKQV